MFSPHIQRLLVDARVEELHQHARTTKRGHDIGRSRATRVSEGIKRGIGGVFAGGRLVRDEDAPAHRFELAGHRSAATSRPRS
jgi:hypothetical protein